MSGLFQEGVFRLHSGTESDFKIDCDALADIEIAVLAKQLSKRVPSFGRVIGVPTGGLRLAEAMRRYVTEGPLLIVDDVLTTGRSMDEMREGDRLAIGAVLFARGKCPEWVTPLFQMHEVRGGNETS